MIEIQVLTRDESCGGCGRQLRRQRERELGRPLRYFQLYIFSDPQYRPSTAICEFCARDVRDGLTAVLGREDK